MTELTRPNPSPRIRADAPPGAATSGTWQWAVEVSSVDDPWELLEHAADHPDWFAWHDGRRGLTYVAWGAVDRLTPSGPERFAEVRDWCAQLIGRFDPRATGLVSGLPLVMGGFSFSPRAGRPGRRWARWPDASFVVPATIVARTPTGTTLEARVRPPATWTAPPSRREERVGGSTHPATPDEKTGSRGGVETREHYEALVTDTVRRIAEGALDKAVVARPTSTIAGGGERFDPIAILRALRDGHPRASCFAVGQGGEVFLGASPETLVAMHGGAMATQAVAGTTKADEDEGGLRLRESAKDEHEHALVVESIRRALEPLCTDLAIGARRLARAGDVHHIVTPIDAHARGGTTVLDAVAALHPTAALCGTPREAAAAWIAEREGFDRGWYGAPVGWLGADGDGVFAVAIRSALIRRHEATAFVGAGIVRGSSPRAEWEETEAKLGPVRRAIALGRQPDPPPMGTGEPQPGDPS